MQSICDVLILSFSAVHVFIFISSIVLFNFKNFVALFLLEDLYFFPTGTPGTAPGTPPGKTPPCTPPGKAPGTPGTPGTAP